MGGRCICGDPLRAGHHAGLCVRCRTSLSTAQRRYVEQFEALLRTGEGIDIALGIARDLGITLERRNPRRANQVNKRGRQ